MPFIFEGTLLTLEYGQYSDRDWDGPYFVTKDIDMEAVSDAYRAFVKESKPRVTPHASAFIPWLRKEGYIVDAPDSRTWRIGVEEFKPDLS